MSMRFSRSIRSLDNDSGIAGLIVVGAMVIIIIGWLIWFCFGQVPVYETSREFTVRQDGQLLVQFLPEALSRIRPGQKVNFLPLVSPNKLGQSLNGIVMDTPASTGHRDDIVHVYLNAVLSHEPENGGEVKILVSHVSPLSLLLQSTH